MVVVTACEGDIASDGEQNQPIVTAVPDEAARVMKALSGVSGLLGESWEEESPAATAKGAGHRRDIMELVPATLTDRVRVDGVDESGAALPEIAVRAEGVRAVAGEKLASDLAWYSRTFSQTHTAVQAVSGGGTRILEIIEGPQAPSSFRFSLDLPEGATLSPLRDGYVVLDANGNPFGQIDPPWAQDAGGQAVRASYSLDGTTLVLNVDHRSAAYPVVADPKITLGWYVYVHYSRSETQRAYNMIWLNIAIAAAASELCSFIPSTPWYLFAAKAVCKGLVAAKAYQAINALKTAHDSGRCVVAKLPYLGGGAFMSYGVETCR